jgi:hypothetical protein
MGVVCETAYLRAKSADFAPASCSRRIPMICSSVNRFFFILSVLNGPDSNRFWRNFSGAGQSHLIGSASHSVLFDLISCASVIIHVDANEIGLGSCVECAGIGRRA